MQRSGVKPAREAEGEVEGQVRTLVVENRRMAKRIQILETEIEEKNRVIGQLKMQLDEGVIESTQEKLASYRRVEEEIDRQVKEAKERFLEEAIEWQQHSQQSELDLARLSQALNEEVSKNSFLLQKIQSLKQYIVDIIEQKDYLISQLGAIISEQQQQVHPCKDCRKRESPCPSAPPAPKKAAIIRRNQ